MKVSVRIFSVLILLCILAAAPAFGQTTFATITGSVTDPAGAAIVAATVEVVQAESNYKYTARANEAGVYTLPQLREGTYELRAQAPGFREAVVRDIRLVARDVRRIDLRLELGTVETRIEVTAGATLIETETARISDTRGARELKSLPMNTRSLWGFLAVTPGVTEATTTSATRRFAGSRRNQSDAAIDGVSITTSNGTQVSPLVQYIESFQEVRIDMANNTAENGAVGQVTVISKSGTNRLHGSLFDYYGTPFFRARNPFAKERSTGIRHTPGGSAGGPILVPKVYDGHDRSFFFFSFETSRGSATQQILNPTVPLPSWRRGDFSALLPGTVVKDPFTGKPYPGNIIPPSSLNPVSRKIQDRFYPLPNYGNAEVFQAQNYREQKIRAYDPNTYLTTRLDHRISERVFLFGRFTWNRSSNREYTGNLPTIGQQWRQRDTRAAAISYTHSIRPNLLNEGRWGLSFTTDPRWGPIRGKQIVGELGLRGLVDNLPDLPGLFNVSFSGLGLTSIAQQVWSDPGFYNLVHQFQDHLSWFRGRHAVKAGVNITRATGGDNTASDYLFGSASFSNRFTGHPYADFLLGIPTTSRRAFPPIEDMRLHWAYDFFVTDEFKVAPRLTLNLGARYELHPFWQATSGMQAVFDIGTGKIVVSDGALNKVSPLLPRGYVDVVEARQAGYPGKRLLDTDKNNFAPRIGLAWRPWGPDTVLRSGFGLYYDVVPTSTSTNGSPFVVNEPSFTNPASSPVVILPLVYPAGVGGPTTVGLPGAMRRDMRIPYSMQYNLTLEHQRWNTGFRISYIGTNTRAGEWNYNINQPLPDARPYVDKPRRFPLYPNIGYTTNGAGHQYNSFNVEVKRQLARGLLYDFSYVWARDIGDLERGASPENAYDRRRERAVWEDIPTHRFAGDLIWELPFGRGRKFLSHGRAWDLIAGGWELSAVYGSNSGQFLTPSWSGPDPTGTAYTTSRTPAQVSIRPNILRSPNLPEADRSVKRWYDVGAFAAPASGFYGTSAKGVIKGPPSWVAHSGIAKLFRLGERAQLRWELTATNIFNHPNWSNPGLNITSQAQAGVITGAGGASGLDETGARSFRMGLRVEW